MNHIISERWKIHVTGEIQKALSGNSAEGIGRFRPLMVLDVEVDVVRPLCPLEGAVDHRLLLVGAHLRTAGRMA